MQSTMQLPYFLPYNVRNFYVVTSCEFLKGSNICKLRENYNKTCCLISFIVLASRDTILSVVTVITRIRMYNVRIKSEMLEGYIVILFLFI